MNVLSKDQVEKLHPELQEQYWEMEANRVRQRLDLIEQAREQNKRFRWIVMLFVIFFTVAIFFIAPADTRGILMLIMNLGVALSFAQCGLIEKRMNALMELLEPELFAASAARVHAGEVEE